ncbi:MAG TPA: pyridoxal-dependent decarboxylase [Candidatus Saccharimonadales bacterium]|nr:pyridoxal-dependent decarboxylase [Candidatus Saccharimonadales bacterium]
MGFDFSSEERRELGYRLIDRIDQYFSSLNNRAVQPPASERTVSHTSLGLPELGSDAARVLDDLCEEMIDKGFHIPAANYFGLMNPTPTYMAVLAEALVSALNPQLASLARSQFASTLEAETIGWIASRFGWHKNLNDAPTPPDAIACDGTFTSGGNEANFTALALAICHHFPHAIEDGIATIGARPVFYASSESHHSLEKSAGLLGLGRKALRRVPVNENLRLDTARLILQIEADYACGFLPFCIVATAGTTSSGAIDDLNALAAIAERYGLWLHVDGAYGAAAAFSDEYRHLLKGIERADSITIDPHKWLSMPFAAGVILTRHVSMMEKTFSVASPYMPRVAGPSMIDNFKVSAQWSRRMNSLKLWLTLRVHGRQAYEQMISRQMQLASEMRAWFGASERFALAAPQTLPILNFRLRGVDEADAEAAHQNFIDEFNRDGRYWISRTHVRGKSVLRMMIISYLSTSEHIAGLQQALQSAAARVAVLHSVR